MLPPFWDPLTKQHLVVPHEHFDFLIYLPFLVRTTDDLPTSGVFFLHLQQKLDIRILVIYNKQNNKIIF